MLYAYYSEIQKNNNGIYYIYLDKDKKEVYATEVSPYKKDTEFFEDNVSLGEVFKFVKSIQLGNSRNRSVPFKWHKNKLVNTTPNEKH
tara:strand:+ start:50 stop:313 length:264 start_codon:yes stop_codon:yes gene_type:complete